MEKTEKDFDSKVIAQRLSNIYLTVENLEIRSNKGNVQKLYGILSELESIIIGLNNSSTIGDADGN